MAVRHGDTPQGERALQAREPPQLLVTTPETLQAILPAKRIGKTLENVKFVIVDEIHELMDNKRGAQLSIGLERLVEKAGEFQRIGISATVADSRQVSRFLCGFHPCQVVDLNYIKDMRFEILYPRPSIEDEEMAAKLYMDAGAAARLRTVSEISKDRKTLIFVNTRSIAEILGSRLMRLNRNVAVHHGSLSRDVRIKIEDDFKLGRLSALVATSSLELGIDIGDVNHVIQYMTPHQITRLVQRVGRSGHTVGGTASGTIVCAEPDDLIESEAIVEMIRAGVLEPNEICANALDVLAHQIAGMSLERDGISIARLLDIIKRAYPYSLISAEKLVQLIEFMHDKGLIRFSSDTVQRSALTRMFYYDNLSTIPSTRKFFVKDATSNTNISTLDEDFVMFLEKNDLFITKGVPWRVLDIDPDRGTMVVEPSQEINAAIPDWEGEEIPTSFEVAQRVGQLKRQISAGQRNTHLDGMDEIRKDLKDFQDMAVEIPSDKHILIEAWSEIAVIHIHGGLKVNRAIATILGERMATEFGSSVRTLVDPYRIAFIMPRPADAERVKKHLLKMECDELKGILPRQQLFKYEFLNIGRKFNLFKAREGNRGKEGSRGEGGGFKMHRISEKFIQALSDTPLYEETMRSVLTRYFDIENTRQIIDGIRGKEIKVTHANVRRLSKAAERALHRYHGTELIAPIEPDSEILKAFRNRLLAKAVILYCTYCGHDWILYIGQLSEHVKCGKCGSGMVAVCDDIKECRLYRKKSLTDEERKKKEYIDKSAAVVAASGKNGVIALSTYGIGPGTAARILARRYGNEDEFFIKLLEAQKRFIANRRYWEMA
ncbi:MAG: DEAD/DEAH box helicase [Candidatus Micrarchaeia archaeon]